MGDMRSVHAAFLGIIKQHNEEIRTAGSVGVSFGMRVMVTYPEWLEEPLVLPICVAVF